MSQMFQPAPEPKTELGRYRILSSTAGVRVSPLQLGAMSIGSAWKDFMGSMDKEQSMKLLDAYYDAGGNFLDTANNYQDEESETWVGEWMKARGNRDNMIIATKYTTAHRTWELGKGVTVNQSGNHKHSMHVSVRDSLRKLQTDYIDILYLHWWDHTTSIEEIMDALHLLVVQGKVLYLGISDSPAWVVSAANEYARGRGKTPFSIYQGRWNVLMRDFERDIIPMARHYGMALAPWDVIGGGKFQTRKAIEEREKSGEGLRSMRGNTGQSDAHARISEALEQVAGEHGEGVSIQAIAIAYVMAKAPNVFPIIGGRKIEHLRDNIRALDIRLTQKQIEFLESHTDFDIGFPTSMIGEDVKVSGKANGLLAATAPLKFVLSPRPIGYEAAQE